LFFVCPQDRKCFRIATNQKFSSRTRPPLAQSGLVLNAAKDSFAFVNHKPTKLPHCPPHALSILRAVVSVLGVSQSDLTANPLRARMSGMKVTKSMATRLAHILLAAPFILSAPFACADDRNLLPKYGGLPETDWQKAANAVFISGMDADYHGDRKKASMDMAMRGWQYLAAGDFDDAMRRFNQAWLLNKKNGTALWGMAAITANSEKYDDSLKLFAEAEKFVGSEINFSVDYARTVGMAGVERKDDALLEDAFERFERIYQKAPQHTKNLQNWAMTLFGTGRYSEAWEKVKLAEATPSKNQIDPSFLAALQSRMPRPEN
jgi:tetratricopeptide (TPR) repeat protein